MLYKVNSLYSEIHTKHTNAVFLRATAKLRNATISFVLSVRPSSRNNSDPTGLIFVKVYTGRFY
jgi:hypothetical protein